MTTTGSGDPGVAGADLPEATTSGPAGQRATQDEAWHSASTPGTRPSASAGLLPVATTTGAPATVLQAAALEGATHAVRAPSAKLRRLLHQHPYELEAALVLALCLGQSAVYSVLRIIERMTRHVPLSQQTSQLNTAATPDRPWLSLVYELADLFFLPVPAALALYLVYRVARPRVGALAGMGLRTDRWRTDLLWGLAFFAGIGIPGLGLYLGARALGLNTTVAAANLGQYWWSIPVLVCSALGNALLEEVVMIGYLFTRLRQAHWPLWRILLLSAVIRGGYHLYQGFGGFLGNLLMGLVFGVWFLRTRRTWPLVACHFLLDVASFVGYALLASHVSWL